MLLQLTSFFLKTGSGVLQMGKISTKKYSKKEDLTQRRIKLNALEKKVIQCVGKAQNKELKIEELKTFVSIGQIPRTLNFHSRRTQTQLTEGQKKRFSSATNTVTTEEFKTFVSIGQIPRTLNFHSRRTQAQLTEVQKTRFSSATNTVT
ncbi:hypothetical protein CEXT_70171 [Caerostris extrusa]|uniref:Uncharacterized protein n=1 Tax=Caerostris extrusa TaxID=172846 RepID=A0AAV4UJA9_CAEEX|nr:hypothetical protein CEXT_70171 [Caerostris extrusa]